MAHFVTRVGFLLLWIGSLGGITWLALHSFFLYVPYVVFLPLFFLAAGLPLVLLWKLGNRRVQLAFVLLGILWLFLLPVIPWNTEQKLLRDAASLTVGIDIADVGARMQAYPSHESDQPYTNLDEFFQFCDAEDCTGTVVNVQFHAGKLVAVQLDLD